MRQSVRNFAKYRYLLTELVKKDIKLKYRRSYLGILWTLLEPLLTMIVLSFVFSKLRGKSGENFPIYILSGRLIYSFFANATKAAMKSIRLHGQMIKKVYVPKYMYPVSAVLAQYITLLISLIVLIAVSAVFKVTPTYHIIEAIVPLFTLCIMALGVGFILATMAVFFRDLEYLWGIVLMMIMYCSAIFYDPSEVIAKGHEWIFQYNPLYAIIKNFRNAVLYGIGPDMWALAYSIIFSVITLVIGIALFYKKQDKFILNL